MKTLKNKKGFTLVELLAVIVILALIMAIAIYSISGILQSSRENTFKETALNIINGVRMQLTASNQLKEGTYYFNEKLLENDNELPFGGKINYGTVTTSTNNSTGNEVIGTNGTIGLHSSTHTDPTDGSNCTASTTSYVSVEYSANKYEFSICLTPKTRTSTSQAYIKGTETNLFGNTTQTVYRLESSDISTGN